jgi:hypothetical protein
MFLLHPSTIEVKVRLEQHPPHSQEPEKPVHKHHHLLPLPAKRGGKRHFYHKSVLTDIALQFPKRKTRTKLKATKYINRHPHIYNAKQLQIKFSTIAKNKYQKWNPLISFQTK